jgi:DNA mismatch repair protein MutL
MKVRVLPDHVANQIAAGEVVDRPAAVVRELVDNAFDAGASDVSVVLENGGHTAVRVVDNGAGMSRDDALLAFERHATSKLGSADDLLSLATLGFRGEALPSIASVAKVELVTRERESDSATRVIIEGGVVRRVETVAGPIGTSIEVRHLFYNVPARKKFLKQPRTEEQRIKQWLGFVAIPRPSTRVRLVSDGREILNVPRRASALERGAQFFRGATIEFTGHSVPPESRQGDDARAITVAGRVGHPALAEATAQSFAVFVNGRLVSDRGLLRAVKEGFDSTLKEREFPVGFVLVTVPPEDVDVNVHPQKSEIRLRAPQVVFGAVKGAVLEAVRRFRGPAVMGPAMVLTPSGTNLLPARGGGEVPRRPELSSVVGLDRGGAVDRPAVGGNLAFAYAPPTFAAVVPEACGEGVVAETVQAPVEGPSFRYADLRYVGLVLDCYLVCEGGGTLVVIDMHAAHERCNYNRIRREYAARSVVAQQLLVPLVVELAELSAFQCLERSDLFRSFGFEIEPFGEHAVLVRSVPTLFGDGDVAALIKEVGALSPDDSAAGRFEERIDHVAARVACHASIRSGETMTRDEVYALLRSLDETELSGACPHGRPVIVSFDRLQVEQWFGRDR